MTLDQRLVDAAIDQMDRRWPGPGEAGAAAVRLDDGEILTSVALDNINGGVGLCHETGAFCQAYTLDRQVTASVCVAREADGRVIILAPCGICRERLALWGPDVEVAVADPADPTVWLARRLADVHVSYWPTAFLQGRWPSYADHTEE